MQIPATPPTFAEYQLIHQTQERQRHPNPGAILKPVASDPWRRKAHLWLGFVGATGLVYWLWNPKLIIVWTSITAVFTGLGLLHQLWEYWKSFKELRARPQPEALEFSEAGLRLRYPAGTVFHAWDSLYCIREVGDWLLLYPDMEFCYYLNLKRLPEPLTAADVRAAIQWQDMRLTNGNLVA